MAEALTDKHLGLSSTVGADRSDSFQYLVDRVPKRIKWMEGKKITIGGEEVLLTAVSQAIPTFPMSMFKIPQKRCIKGLLMVHLVFGGAMMWIQRKCTSLCDGMEEY